MKIILDDISVKEQLYPFAAIKSAVEIRVGILTIKERWQKLLQQEISILSEFENKPDDHSIVIPANLILDKKSIEVLIKDGLHSFINTNTHTINHPADIFKYNDQILRNDFDLIVHNKISQVVSCTNTLINPSQIFIEEGASVEHCILNATHGPIYIGKNAEIMEGCLIRGPFALCEGAILKMGAKIYGATTIGPFCTAGGEIKNSVLFGYSNKAHDGYLGDSVIGEWCNLGAGTSNSNVKNNAAIVKVWSNVEKKIINVSNKCGLIMGSYSRAGINTSFNTGTTIGICCNIFGENYPSKYVADFSWGNEKYELDKAFIDIDNWKKLKGSNITEEEKQQLTLLYNKNK